MTVFDRIKILCKNRGITLAKLEDELEFSRNSLYAWKKKNPSGTNLSKVADYFNVSVDYLLGRDEDAEFESFINDTSLQIMMREIAESPEEKREQLRQMWDIIKKS